MLDVHTDAFNLTASAHDVASTVASCMAIGNSIRQLNPVPVWLWMDFPDGIPPHLALVRRALTRHAPAPRFAVHELSVANIHKFVHDLPREALAVAALSPAAMSDLARTALLALHGGVWLDTDILLAKPLSRTVAPLATHDAVSYTINGHQASKGHFSSNFFAARPCLPLWLLSWGVIKQMLTRRCGQVAAKRREFCCEMKLTGINARAAASELGLGGGAGPDGPWCRPIAWGSLGESISHPISSALATANSSLRIHTYSDDESFAPSCQGAVSPFNVYLQRIATGQCRVTALHGPIVWSYSPPARAFEPLPFNGSACCQQRGDMLECWRTSRHGISSRSVNPSFFNRRACISPQLRKSSPQPAECVSPCCHQWRCAHQPSARVPVSEDHLFNHVHGRAARRDGSCPHKFTDSCAYNTMGNERTIERGPWVLSQLVRDALGEATGKT